MNGKIREIRVLVNVSDVKVTYDDDDIIEICFNILKIF